MSGKRRSPIRPRVDSGSPQRKVSAGGPVESLVISADGRWLATSGCVYGTGNPTDCVMRLWDASTLKEIRKWDENAFALAISPATFQPSRCACS